MKTLHRSVAAVVAAAAFGCAAAAPALAVDSSTARAASWLASQTDKVTTAGGALENLIALSAADDPALQPSIDTLLASAKSGAAAYISSGGGAQAGKTAVVAGAYDIDPTSFGGVDLVAKLKAGVAADGSVGPYPSVFSSGVAAAGFERAGVATPAELITWVIAQQNADGGFGYAAGQPSDADSTAMAILALATDDSAAAKASLAKAVAWAEKSQQADGSWAGFVPVNSTCVLGSALIAAGQTDAKALAFVKSQQLESGAIAANGQANMLATSQCVPFLAGKSYLSVEWSPAQPKPTTTTTSAKPTADPSKPATKPTDAKPTGSATAAPTGSTEGTRPSGGRGVAAHTGVEDELPVGAFALVALALAGLSTAAGRTK